MGSYKRITSYPTQILFTRYCKCDFKYPKTKVGLLESYVLDLERFQVLSVRAITQIFSQKICTAPRAFSTISKSGLLWKLVYGIDQERAKTLTRICF